MYMTQTCWVWWFSCQDFEYPWYTTLPLEIGLALCVKSLYVFDFAWKCPKINLCQEVCPDLPTLWQMHALYDDCTSRNTMLVSYNWITPQLCHYPYVVIYHTEICRLNQGYYAFVRMFMIVMIFVKSIVKLCNYNCISNVCSQLHTYWVASRNHSWLTKWSMNHHWNYS